MSGQLFLHSNISNETVPYFNIFKTSVGGSNGDGEYFKGIGKLYKTNPRFQRGYGLQSGKFNHTKKRGTGIGSFFQSLWRVAFPMIKSGAKNLVQQLLTLQQMLPLTLCKGKI